MVDPGKARVVSPGDLLMMPVTGKTDLKFVLLLYMVNPFLLPFSLKSVKIV